MSEQLNELAFYTLAGGPSSPAAMLDELPQAEDLGFGSVFIGERFNVKEAVTLSGAAGAVSRTLGITTGATNHNTRHPIVTASYATTMHRLTGGRFALGLGRGVNRQFDAFGMPRITTAQVEDFVGLMRRLWRGEAIFDYDGPVGKFPVLYLDSSFDEDIPIGFTAFAPNSLALCGRVMDMVILHTFFTDETVVRSVQTVRDAAERAGRDPAAVRIWSCYATVHDGLPHDVQLKKTVGRLATYLQGYGDLMVKTNQWDPADLERFRNDPDVVAFEGRSIDEKADVHALQRIQRVIPEAWLEPAATGSPDQCAAAVLRQFDLGVDGVIMHGANPEQLTPVVDAYRRIRPEGRFDNALPNPGRSVAP